MLIRQIGTILKARWGSIFLTTSVVVASALAIQLARPPLHVAETSLLVDFRTADPATGGVIPPVYLPTYLANQIDIVRSRDVAAKVVKRLTANRGDALDITVDPPDEPLSTDQLLSDLSLATSKQASVIYIRFASPDAVYAADVVNAFADSYVETIQEMRTAAVQQRTLWFDQQLDVLRDKVVSVQARLAAVQQETGIVSLDERIDVENAKLMQLSRQLVDVQTEAQDTASRARQARRLIDGRAGVEAVTDLVGNAFVTGLRAQLAKEESRVSELSSQLGNNHPQYERAVAELAKLRKRFNGELRTAVDQLDNQATLLADQVSALTRDVAAQKDKILHIQQARGRVDVVLRELESAQRAYDTALAELSKTHLEGNVDRTSATVLNRAVGTDEPADRDLLKTAILGTVIGLLFGTTLALIAERVDRRLRSPSDVSALLGIPLIGVISRQAAAR